MIEAKRKSSLSLPINSVKVQLSRLNKKRNIDQGIKSPVSNLPKRLRGESYSPEGSDHRLTPPTTPVPEVLFGIEDQKDEESALDAANFFADLKTPDVMKAFPGGHLPKIKTELTPTTSSAPTSSLNTPQITLTSSGQVIHPLATSEAMRGSTTYSDLAPFLDDDTEGDMSNVVEGSLNTPNVDPSGNDPFIFSSPYNQQPLLSHQSRTHFSQSAIATHITSQSQPLFIDVQEQHQMVQGGTSCEPSPSDQALEYAPPPYQQQQASYTDLQVQQHHRNVLQELPTTVAEHCRYSPPMSAAPSPVPSNESSLASSSSPANQDQYSTEHFFGSSRGSLGRKGSDASSCSVGSKSRKTKKQQFTELVQRQQYLTQHNEELRNQLKCYERACAKLKMMLLDKMKNAARMC